MNAPQAPVLARKNAQQQIETALLSLSDLESSLGKKKFKRRLKKASKLLTQGMPKAKNIKAAKGSKVHEQNPS